MIFDIGLRVNNLQMAGQLPTPAVALILTCSQFMLFTVRWHTRVNSQLLHGLGWWTSYSSSCTTSWRRRTCSPRCRETQLNVLWLESSHPLAWWTELFSMLPAFLAAVVFSWAFVTPRGDFCVCACISEAKRERKSLKSKIISPLSHPAATINSQVIREHAFVRDSNRYFVLMFIECIFWVLHLKHWGSKSVKNCAPTSIIYF